MKATSAGVADVLHHLDMHSQQNPTSASQISNSSKNSGARSSSQRHSVEQDGDEEDDDNTLISDIIVSRTAGTARSAMYDCVGLKKTAVSSTSIRVA